MMPLMPETSWAFQLGGGGGWGDPLERSAAAVLDDVLDGYVSIERARKDYGVMLTADGRSVDEQATRLEREARR
jgi:N-methylhydantoinase B